ncbi:hypothetical protein ZWY2020_040490 [Hordeum vulgare]|nr:hypothetical protein ZWY2020_040490 [Hordeum vulgare]
MPPLAWAIHLTLLRPARARRCHLLLVGPLAAQLEQESGFYFNTKYFEEKVHAGEWDEVERYLSGFTKVDDNRYSMKMIRKQKYLEALDRHDRAKAVDILIKDLKFLVIDVCLIWSCNDDNRIRASMPSIKFLMGKGAKVVLPTICRINNQA